MAYPGTWIAVLAMKEDVAEAEAAYTALCHSLGKGVPIDSGHVDFDPVRRRITLHSSEPDRLPAAFEVVSSSEIDVEIGELGANDLIYARSRTALVDEAVEYVRLVVAGEITESVWRRKDRVVAIKYRAANWPGLMIRDGLHLLSRAHLTTRTFQPY